MRKILTTAVMLLAMQASSQNYETQYSRPVSDVMKDVAKRQEISFPIGGIGSGEKALEYLYAGANAVEVGGAALYDPTAPIRVARELEELLDSRPELTEKLAKGDTWR